MDDDHIEQCLVNIERILKSNLSKLAVLETRLESIERCLKLLGKWLEASDGVR